ncbi:MAG: cbb3-type cytochrome c oxidase subunit I [Terrimicrobiaceae bacterium]
MSSYDTATTPAARGEAALRLSVTLFLSSAVFWLVVGSLLFCLAAWKLVVPSFLDGTGWLTYGRILPAAENALAYGWASQAGIGLGLWLLARLGRTALGSERLLITAGLFWNLGVLLGVCSIIAGAGRAIRGLEFSGAASFVLLIAYVCIGVWGLILLRDRSSDGLYVSQWYLLAAFLCFPWLYATANMLLVWNPVQGSAQGPIASWYLGSLLWLWLAPLALAAVYYLVPHIARRPVRAYPSSVLAFWCLTFLGGWTGTRLLIGGPIPAWLVSASVAASIMMLIPATLVCINTLGTLDGREVPRTPEAPFTIFAMACFAAVVLQGAATPLISTVTHFSDYSMGQDVLVIFGFLSMALFGASYHAIPRLTGREFPAALASLHFWLSVGGVGTMFLALTLGGFIQGFALYDPGVDFMSSVSLAAPFRAMYALGTLVFLGACLVFAAAFTRNLLGGYSPLVTPGLQVQTIGSRDV